MCVNLMSTVCGAPDKTPGPVGIDPTTVDTNRPLGASHCLSAASQVVRNRRAIASATHAETERNQRYADQRAFRGRAAII